MTHLACVNYFCCQGFNCKSRKVFSPAIVFMPLVLIHEEIFNTWFSRSRFKGKLTGDLNMIDVTQCLSHVRDESRIQNIRPSVHAKHVLKTLKAFIASDDDVISQKHVPLLDSKKCIPLEEEYTRKVCKIYTNSFHPCMGLLNPVLLQVEIRAGKVWERMTDGSFKMTHDGLFNQ